MEETVCFFYFLKIIFLHFEYQYLNITVSSGEIPLIYGEKRHVYEYISILPALQDEVFLLLMCLQSLESVLVQTL